MNCKISCNSAPSSKNSYSQDVKPSVGYPQKVELHSEIQKVYKRSKKCKNITEEEIR